MFARLVDVDVHGGTGAEFRRVLTIATLSGRLEEGIMTAARLTAAQESLGPFLVNLRAHLAQGPEALRGFLALEARLLRHQQAAHRQQTMGMLELVAELVMVLLVVPALVVVIVTMLGPIVPVSTQVVPTPVGARPLGELIVYLAGGFVLAVGGVAGQMVATLRPQEHVTTVTRPRGAMATVAAAGSNPAAMSIVATVPMMLVTAGLGVADGRLGLALVVGFTTWATIVGVVGWRQAREDDAKDEHLRELVHAVAGYVELGIPFGDAVDRIAQETDLGPLRPDVAHLAFDLRLRDRHPDHAGTTQEVALDRFAHRVGTPLAARTVGVIASALAAGADPRLIFERLQTQVAELYRSKQSMRAEMQVYAAVGWTTALLVVGISVAATTQLFDQLAMVSTMGGQAIAGADYRVMLTTVATAIAAGWFSGMAIRDRYAGLLHAGVLSMITITVGWLGGML
jgi:flagellar protein FlaJ